LEPTLPGLYSRHPAARGAESPRAYPLPRGDRELVDFINVWLDLKKRDRTIETLYDYWILGKNAVPKQPRCVICQIKHLYLTNHIHDSFSRLRPSMARY